jgi:hypothetical protein
MREKQQGVTVVGMILIAAGIVFVVIIGLKMIPAYVEFASIQNHLRELASAPDTQSGSPSDIRLAFNRRAQIDDINSVRGQDLDISREGGNVVLSVTYEKRVHLMGNVDACIEFVASSD